MHKVRPAKHLKFAVLATDVVALTVLHKKLNVLLIKPTYPDYKGQLALPGGLIHKNEMAEESAARHLKDKGGLSNIFLEQLYTFSSLDRDKRGRVISVAYLALVSKNKCALDNDSARWLPVKDAKKLAYDHDEILDVGVKRLRSKLSYSNIAGNLLPKEFTLTELQDLYEIILNKELDKRNFRKKILKIGLVEKTKKMRRGGANRPAALYKWASKKIQDTFIVN